MVSYELAKKLRDMFMVTLSFPGIGIVYWFVCCNRYIEFPLAEIQDGRLALFFSYCSFNITNTIVGDNVDAFNAVFTKHRVEIVGSSILTTKVMKTIARLWWNGECSVTKDSSIRNVWKTANGMGNVRYVFHIPQCFGPILSLAWTNG